MDLIMISPYRDKEALVSFLVKAEDLITGVLFLKVREKTTEVQTISVA